MRDPYGLRNPKPQDPNPTEYQNPKLKRARSSWPRTAPLDPIRRALNLPKRAGWLRV